jgi:hypothetical protein
MPDDKNVELNGLRNIIGSQHFGGIAPPPEDLTPDEYAIWYWRQVAWHAVRIDTPS